ncbi:ROK family protein [Ruminococcaceae bacterium OttesenSCG-928-D13]|nr:ROK family protein [Ruminococcaceae bacterium OttesenSCG-928-D13]
MMGNSPGPMQLKNASRLSVLDQIRRSGTATKAALAAESGLSFMAIQKIMEELTGRGLVRQHAWQAGHVGRKAVIYTIDEHYGYTVGLHVNMFKTRAAVMDLHGEIVAYRSAGMEELPADPAGLIEALAEMVRQVLAESKVPRKRLLGLGVGVPGPVDTEAGRVLSPPNLPALRYMPLGKIMADKLGLPVLLAKDTNAIAMGEYWRGAGAGYGSVVYVDADMGIGSGMILNGGVHEGANAIAGEFGHIVIDPHGPLCNCGSRGCLEAMGSGIAILRRISAELAGTGHPLAGDSARLTLQQVLAAGSGGDARVVPVLNDAAHLMGLAIGNIINILDPEVIILGGALVLEYPPYFGVVQQAAATKRLPGAGENRIVRSGRAWRAGVIGAGEIVASHFFSHLVGEVLQKG